VNSICVTIDCVDPVRLAELWAALLDRDAVPGLPGWVRLTRIRHQYPQGVVVLADPEGNEFYVTQRN
jgi:hypothetical protein